MTAREELAQSISANFDRMFGKREFGPATQDYELADALLAEGWGKLADGWDEGYALGVADEQTSSMNIGLEGLGVKSPANRTNPYRSES